MISKENWLIATHVPKKLFRAGTLFKTRLVDERDGGSLSRRHTNLKIATLRSLDIAELLVHRLQKRDKISLGCCFLETFISSRIYILILLGIQL